MRHEAPRHIPSTAGKNSEGGSWIRWLTWTRKRKGTVACQKSNGRAQAYETRRCGIRVIRRKLDCLYPNLQEMQVEHPPERRLKPCEHERGKRGSDGSWRSRGLRCCMGDGGCWPSRAVVRTKALNHRKGLWLKTVVLNVADKARLDRVRCGPGR